LSIVVASKAVGEEIALARAVVAARSFEVF
jgi:hypothetical protein